MESLCRLLKRYDPVGGEPAPIAAIYAANTCTEGEFEHERKRLELQEKVAWGRRYRDIRNEMMAREQAAEGGSGA